MDAGVESALIHGGTSTVCAIGAPPGGGAWKVAIETPVPAEVAAAGTRTNAPQPKALLATVSLRDESLSVSAVWGRSFAEGSRTYGHVLDPRTGQPVDHALLSAVVLPSATETDAVSTALLTMGWPGMEWLQRFRPSARALVVRGENGVLQTNSFGFPEGSLSP